MKEKCGFPLVLLLLTSFMSFIASEVLIFYNPEARADWFRMLPVAIISPIMFMMASVFMVASIISVKFIFEYFAKYISRGDPLELIMTCAFVGAGLVGGGGTVARWIKHIVIDNYPAFGYNPNNVYAVVGANTMFFIPLGCFAGAVMGLMLGGLLFLAAKTIKLFLKS